MVSAIITWLVLPTVRDIFALKENVPQVYILKVRFNVTFLFKRDGTFFNYMVGPDF